MDIKDWILIGGGLLLAAVIGHGFWLAWKSRRDPLRMEIERNLPTDDVDPITQLRGELPNGGARVVKQPEQASLALGAAGAAGASGATIGELAVVDSALITETRTPRKEPTRPSSAVPKKSILDRPRPMLTSARRQAEALRNDPQRNAQRDVLEEAEAPTPAPQRPDEIIVINVLSRGGGRFTGSDLMAVFLRNALKFGDMNIFHRIDPATKLARFSVASAVEPGTFDLGAMERFATPGVSFFLKLPGAPDPLGAFDDMLTVARDVATTLSGELKDEHHSVMTNQTVEHCRQRIADFSRKRMSQRG